MQPQHNPHRVVIFSRMGRPGFLFDLTTIGLTTLFMMGVRDSEGGWVEFLGTVVLAFALLHLIRWGVDKWRMRQAIKNAQESS